MKKKISILFLPLLVVALSLFGNQTDAKVIDATMRTPKGDQAVALSKIVRQYAIVDLDFSAVGRLLESASPSVSVRLNATPELQWDLTLAKRDLRSSDYRQEWSDAAQENMNELDNIMTWQGVANNRKENIVRLTIDDQRMMGYIQDGDRFFFLEPLSNVINDSGTSLLIYEPKDLLPSADFSSEVADALIPLLDTQDKGNGPAPESSLLSMEIATDADYEYYQRYGVGTNDQILSILNLVEGLYELNFGLRFEVTYQHVNASASDPYTETDPAGLLNEFQVVWEDQYAGVARDIAHLWTGKDLNGNATGMAWLASVCRYENEYSYSLSQDYAVGTYGAATLAAHEIGHNLNGRHEDGQNCSPNVGGTGSVMCDPVQTEGYYFSPAEQSRLSAYIGAYGSCLEGIDRSQLWVDFGYSGFEQGTETQPFNSIQEGIDTVDAGGTITIQTGTSPERPSTNKPQTWKANGGWVTIGE